MAEPEVADKLRARCNPSVAYTPLTPPAFLGRAAEVFANKSAIVYGERESSYREFASQATPLAH